MLSFAEHFTLDRSPEIGQERRSVATRQLCIPGLSRPSHRHQLATVGAGLRFVEVARAAPMPPRAPITTPRPPAGKESSETVSDKIGPIVVAASPPLPCLDNALMLLRSLAEVGIHDIKARKKQRHATITEKAGCDEKLIAAAFGNFARAKGMMKVARDFGFAR